MRSKVIAVFPVGNSLKLKPSNFSIETSFVGENVNDHIAVYTLQWPPDRIVAVYSITRLSCHPYDSVLMGIFSINSLRPTILIFNYPNQPRSQSIRIIGVLLYLNIRQD
jgi:hypothetical protein